uniref:Soluble scavenger receptor cysteine-rich domain-containing protein SSC5D n=1 Tax=Latimeria chalumnae TaxID=7897 RepID=H3AS36_LATCH
EVRLVNGFSSCSGRVEVYHDGQWGTVCDNGWDIVDTEVVCRELGCGPAVAGWGWAWFGPGSGVIWLDDVQCTINSSSLSSCEARPWGTHSCNHWRDAGVICSGNSYQVRLVNGPSRCAGRVEVFHSGQWGTVCDDEWNLADAEVVCRQLGCGPRLSAPRSATYGQGTGQIWLDNVQCSAYASSLSNCRANSWGNNNCHHSQDAGVVCSVEDISEHTQVRLVNGFSPCSGRVEVFHEGEWGTVCDDYWDYVDAAVVCRQLGCGFPLFVLYWAAFGQGTGRIWLDNVHCEPDDPSIYSCRANSWGSHNCRHYEDASVVCLAKNQLRLVNGSGRCAGRVEVYHNGEWGTVCHDDWNLDDGDVVCRQLECGSAISTPESAVFGEGSGVIWLDEVQCTAAAHSLSSCRANSWGDNNCIHEQDAGVVCS